MGVLALEGLVEVEPIALFEPLEAVELVEPVPWLRCLPRDFVWVDVPLFELFCPELDCVELPVLPD